MFEIFGGCIPTVTDLLSHVLSMLLGAL